MRTKFDEQLAELNRYLTQMGALCEEAIANAVKGLICDDPGMLERVQAADEKIDRMERDIEELCIRLLLHQQPVASDLRTVSSALKMISDMERIGDQASDIAEMLVFVTNTEVKSKTHIAEMANETIKMVKSSVESFVNKDLRLAKEVLRMDDKVDALFLKVREELKQEIGKSNTDSEALIDILMIAKYFERIGDHAENIAEWVEFSITGEHE